MSLLPPCTSTAQATARCCTWPPCSPVTTRRCHLWCPLQWARWASSRPSMPAWCAPHRARRRPRAAGAWGRPVLPSAADPVRHPTHPPAPCVTRANALKHASARRLQARTVLSRLLWPPWEGEPVFCTLRSRKECQVFWCVAPPLLSPCRHRWPGRGAGLRPHAAQPRGTPCLQGAFVCSSFFFQFLFVQSTRPCPPTCLQEWAAAADAPCAQRVLDRQAGEGGSEGWLPGPLARAHCSLATTLAAATLAPGPCVPTCRGASPAMVQLECFVDGSHITTTQADGLIIATPSGSTAYSMSAGARLLAVQLLAPSCLGRQGVAGAPPRLRLTRALRCACRRAHGRAECAVLHPGPSGPAQPELQAAGGAGAGGEWRALRWQLACPLCLQPPVSAVGHVPRASLTAPTATHPPTSTRQVIEVHLPQSSRSHARASFDGRHTMRMLVGGGVRALPVLVLPAWHPAALERLPRLRAAAAGRLPAERPPATPPTYPPPPPAARLVDRAAHLALRTANDQHAPAG